MSTEIADTRNELAAYLKRHPRLKAHGGKTMKNLAILASDADDNAKADAFRVLPANVERFKAARNR